MMNDDLTKKQKEVLNAIKKYINQNGISPTFEELKNILYFKSNNSLVQFFKSLEKKGYIE
jgi:SOS-response transcriptional repressor LexA